MAPDMESPKLHLDRSKELVASRVFGLSPRSQPAIGADFYRVFFGGRLPLLKSTTAKSWGTLILTSNLQDLVIFGKTWKTILGGKQEVLLAFPLRK